MDKALRSLKEESEELRRTSAELVGEASRLLARIADLLHRSRELRDWMGRRTDAEPEADRADPSSRVVA
jgi:hypothetical protein